MPLRGGIQALATGPFGHSLPTTLPKRKSSPAGKLSTKPIKEAGTPPASPKMPILTPMIC